MSERSYWELSEKASLTAWITGQMLKGAGYAAAVVIGIGLVMWAIWGIGLLLPEASKEAPPPNLSRIEVPAAGSDLA